ncbi:hypothetical protein [Nostoc sp. FACHB-857]|uniref:mevalonate kinase family protein n=1 Tax=Nostoc sp. FACHB-857 TaxID=2692840 RepID=UPI0028C48503|nr:hypothetical protein [Nostoc sp. FACHB-857]
MTGRLCLFGEHSDWAGEYRRINPQIEKGYTLIVGTNQGIYASVKPNSTELIIRPSLNDGRHYEPLRLPMESNTLLCVAQKGGFFSYAAGTAYQFLTRYGVGGLEVDNYLTDLPIQKGLSSSAAFCVLIARAFNHLYDLKMTIREEMELAYLGERTTPSLCGRMDQACAYGNRPILMIFDGEQIDIRELTVSKDLFFVIVDLGGSKDTQEILRRLNECYPIATNPIGQNVQKYLGSISAEITQAAVEAIQLGDAQLLGALMTKAQAEFDQYVVPACPEELTAKKLHLLLNHEPLSPYIFGGKGVGSQGDGTAQLIVNDKESQTKAIEIIQRDFPQMQAFKDSQILKTVNPEVIQTHLQATGWQETGRIYNDAGAIWRLKKDADPEYEILLPLQHDLGDYAERISDILKTLSAVENRSQVDILSEFITNYPNFTVLGVVMQIATPSIDKLSGEITLLGAIFERLQEIKTSLADHDYILAIKAYQERLPIHCTGDLVKVDNHFILRNPQNFQIDIPK